MTISDDMLHLYFLRIGHFNSLNRNSQTAAIFFLLICTAFLLTTVAHAESNVAGEEIVIFSDDTFKPAPHNIGSDAAGNGNSGNANYARSNTGSANTGNTDLTGTSLSTNNPEISSSRQHGAENSSLNDEKSELADTKLLNDDLWQRIKNGYGIPNSTSTLIAHHEDWYSSRPDYMRRMVERSQKYLFHIVEEVEKRGMPTEIALLPMVESAYNPQANSTSRASGIWQFIPSTGKNFGLKQNWWVDNRRNVTAATDAALTYLQKLHAMFGTWDLALAAYNAGEGTVSRAIERNRRLGLPTDYEDLNLPAETKNYVPKLQAIKNLMTNPDNYGLKIQTIANSAYFTKVSAPAQIDAHLAAKLAGITDQEFLALNPSFNRPVITSTGDKHELLLPIAAAEVFKNNLASYNKPLVSWQTYYARRGEIMDKIASKFGIQVGQLRDVNNLPTQKKITKSATILVPNGNKADFDTHNVVANTKIETSTNVNLADEQLSGTAQTDQTDYKNSKLSSEQNSANIDLVAAQSNNDSIINVSDKIDPNEHRTIIYKVKRGERLQSIANRYAVSVKQIVATNSLKSNHITAGQLLSIRTVQLGKVVGDKAVKIASKNDVVSHKKHTYIVKRGDTLNSIAQKFDVAIVDIKRWNKNISARIQPGNKLTIMQLRSA